MKIIECPRDAMQGLSNFVATDDKVNYINTLLSVGFDTIDFGSFVSPKAIPQMRDTVEVLEKLELSNTKSKLLAIVANLRGAKEALQYKEINYLGFPLSISETFQQRNTNKSTFEALQLVKEIFSLTEISNKKLVVYISMGFGNPYGEAYNPQLVEEFISKLVDIGITIISLADTIGAANKTLIQSVFEKAIQTFPTIEIGAHFHSLPQSALDKIEVAWEAGCTRIDSAIGGMGGCPMAKNDLTGNIDTSILIDFCVRNHIEHNLDLQAYNDAYVMKKKLFG